MQSKHGEELKAIDDEFAQITAIEQAANDFTRKYKQRASVDKGDAQELATRLTTPTNLTATARNWGDARFTSAIAAQADRT